MCRLHSEPRRGFTLVEFIVVIAILGVSLGMLFPALAKARENSRVKQCQENLHEISDAIHNYASSHEERFPPLLDYVPGEKGTGWTPFWLSLAPYLNAGDLVSRAKGTEAGWKAGNHEAVLNVLLCPADPSAGDGLCTSGAKGWAGTSYAPIYHLFGAVNKHDVRNDVFIAQAKYTNLNLNSVKGNGNQIGVVERYANFPDHDWSNATFYPMDRVHWGANRFGSAYGAWGFNPPQPRAGLTGEGAADPRYPNSGHRKLHALMMDGAIRPVTSTPSAGRCAGWWQMACEPDGVSVLPGCW